MKSKLREKAIQLRTEQELSYTEIRKRLNVSKSTLSYWLREYPLSEDRILELRQKGWEKGEASRERYRNTMRLKKERIALETYKKKKQDFRKISKQTAYVAGLMLYYAEGEKKSSSRIMLANTDVKMILFFKRWLQNFLEVDPSKMRLELHLYENMDIEKERLFWKQKLCFDDSQFYKTQIRPMRPNSFSYKETCRHGTCSLSYDNVTKKTELMMAIKAFIDSAF